MKREVIKKILFGAGAIIFDLTGLIGCAMISWKAALWYFGFMVIGSIFQLAYKGIEIDLTVDLATDKPTAPVEPQLEAQPVEEVILTETKVHTKPKKKPIKKVKKPIVKE